MENEIESLEIKTIKNLSAKFAKEAQQIQSRLDKFGLNDSDLDQSARRCFDYLVDLASQLKLDSVDESCYIVALESLLNEASKHEYSKIIAKEESTKLKESLFKLNLYQETLKKDLKMLSDSFSTKKEMYLEKESDLELLRRKIEKYLVQLKEFQEKRNNVSSNLLHENLIQDHKNMIKLQQRLSEEKTRLEMYDNLPPNITLAKSEIENIENQIKLIDKEIEKKLEII